MSHKYLHPSNLHPLPGPSYDPIPRPELVEQWSKRAPKVVMASPHGSCQEAYVTIKKSPTELLRPQKFINEE